MARKKFRIALIPGDGIGTEVVPEGVKVLEGVARTYDLDIHWQSFDWSCERYQKTGRMMPEDAIDQL